MSTLNLESEKFMAYFVLFMYKLCGMFFFNLQRGYLLSEVIKIYTTQTPPITARLSNAFSSLNG